MRALEEAENRRLLLLLPRVRPARAVAKTYGLRAYWGCWNAPGECRIAACDRAVLPDAPVRRSRTLPGRP